MKSIMPVKNQMPKRSHFLPETQTILHYLLVFGNSIIPYPVRRYLFLDNKKCRIYAACGVSQTPK